MNRERLIQNKMKRKSFKIKELLDDPSFKTINKINKHVFFQGAYGHLQSENQYLKNKLLQISTNYKCSEEKDEFDTTSEDDNSHDSRTMNNSLTSLDIKGKYSRLSPNTSRDE